MNYNIIKLGKTMKELGIIIKENQALLWSLLAIWGVISLAETLMPLLLKVFS